MNIQRCRGSAVGALLGLLAVSCSDGAPGFVEIGATGTTGDELLGTVSFNAFDDVGQFNGPCAGIPGGLSLTDITRIQSWIRVAAARSRATAASPAMAECLEDAMEGGNINYPWGTDANAGPFGPYCKPGEPDCEAGEDGLDPYNNTALAGASMTLVRRAQSMRLFNEGQASLPITLYCDNETGPTAGCGGSTINTPGRTERGTYYIDDEKVFVSRPAVETILGRASCNAHDPPYNSYFTSQLMWHEGLHFHGYDHEVSFDVEVWRKQAVGIYNFCMHRIQQVSAQSPNTPALPAICNTLTCPTDYHRLVSNHVHDAVAPAGCVCVRDPQSSAPRVDRTIHTGSASFAVDSKGRFYRLTGTTVARRDGSSWTTVHANASLIYAGGDRLFVISGGSVFRSNKATNAFTNLGSAAALNSQMAADDFGTFYKINSTGTVARARVAETSFTTLAIVNASRVYAGGDQLFVRDAANGNIRRHNPLNSWTTIGSPGDSFAVDETGTIYGLTPDRSTVVRYSGATNTWTTVGGAATAILGGRRLFATNSAGDVFELNAKNEWWFVASSSSGWAAGGPNVVIRTGNTWHAYTDY